jgi:ribosomal-protein-serine acetyltransferase|tara:strand:+ start:1752 stop:2306 length:555 start_codon:yes stop_codon:yes gene_type:complete
MPFSLSIDDTLDLRLLGLEDAAKMSELIHGNRAFLRQWLPWVDGEHRPSDSAKVINLWRQSYAKGSGFSLGIIFQNELVGIIGYHGFDQVNRITSIGYWLIESETGKGIMTRSIRTLMNYAIEERNMNRIFVRCATGNTASRAIPERLGFTHEGTQRDAEWLYDHYVNLELYAILAHEWTTEHN